MKLTKSQLKQIIKEEIATTLQEWEPGTSLVPGSVSPESGVTQYQEHSPEFLTVSDAVEALGEAEALKRINGANQTLSV